MAFQSGAVFSEVTLFPKKRHSFGSTFFVFFPRRRFETQETVPTGIVARPPRSRSSRSLDLRKSRNVPRRCFVFGTRIQSASRGRRRKGPTELEFRVAKRRRARRERAFGSADGNDRLASRRVLDSRAFPGARRVPRERGDASRDRAHRVIIIASSANDGCVETRDARLFVGCPGIGRRRASGRVSHTTRISRVRRVFVRWTRNLNFREFE